MQFHVHAAALAVLALAPLGGHAAAPPFTLLNGLVAGGEHTCAIKAPDAAFCWGSNTSGQLGDGTTHSRAGPVLVAGLPGGVMSLAAGQFHTCALMIGGRVKCWGRNRSGQLGDGTTIDRRSPVDVAGIEDAASITAGPDYTCAVTIRNVLKCWGANRFGQLGDGTNDTRLLPVDVADGMAAVSASGVGHTCGLTVAGRPRCWGHNLVGQLGNGNTMDQRVPTDVVGLDQALAIDASAYATCALTTAAGVKCWGGIFAGPLVTTPTDQPGLASGVVAISMMNHHGCALTTSLGVKCWGVNSSGQLGDGTLASREAAADVVGLASRADNVFVGGAHSCSMLQSGEVQCWGANNRGQLGIGRADPSWQPTPATVRLFASQSITFDALADRDLDAPFTLAASASSGLPVSFVPLTPFVCPVSGAVVSFVGYGVCSILATQGGNDDYLPAPDVARSFLVRRAAAGAAPRLANVSARAPAGTVENNTGLIAGFIVGGSTGKQVVVRVRGPSLEEFGVPNRLADPMLELHSSTGGLRSQNDDWMREPQFGPPVWPATSLLIEALGLAPSDEREAAIKAFLEPGAYTVVVKNSPGTPPGGVALIEVFEVDSPESPLSNISTRGLVSTDTEVMIGGFIVRGETPQAVVVRARGPSLAAHGIDNPLANPSLVLVRSADGAILAANDAWESASNAAEIAASGFAPSHALESAILVTLPPGAYTAIVRGAGGATGVGIVEVFAQ